MIIIIFQIIFGLSVGMILFLIFRKIPVLLKYPRKESEKTIIYDNVQEQWGKIREKLETSEFLHEHLIPKIEKFLRKTKVIVLKFDNFLAKRADKLRERIRKRRRENRGGDN